MRRYFIFIHNPYQGFPHKVRGPYPTRLDARRAAARVNARKTTILAASSLFSRHQLEQLARTGAAQSRLGRVLLEKEEAQEPAL